MKVKKKYNLMKSIFYCLFYLAVLLYTLTFSTPVSWLILYFFTALLLLTWLSTWVFWKHIEFQVSRTQQKQLNGHLLLKTKGYIPVLMPELQLSVTVLGETFSTVLPSLFKTTLTADYKEIHLPRGHHKSLLVRSYGKDLFGFFMHQRNKTVATDLTIFPKIFPSALLYPILKQIDSNLKLQSFLGQSDATFRQLREHQMQDPLKDIDWKSSFKRQELMVKEYDKETDTSLMLYFLGISSPQFEELLSLTYNLYKELARFQKVHLYLIGEFDETLQTKQVANGFLTIQPTTQIEQVKEIWEQQTTVRSQKIVAAPIEIVSALREIEARSTYFLSEETLTKLHIGGD